MPHYDESFIFDDNQNQRKNKRSYHVYKNGVNPRCLEKTEVLYDLEERGKTALKRNIRNIKHRGNRYKPDSHNGPHISNSYIKYRTPDIIIAHCPQMSVFDPNKYYDLRNNNVLPLVPCKSLDNLTLKKGKKKNSLRNGASLQNLLDEGTLKHYGSPLDYRSYPSREDAKNSYSVVEARCRPMQQRRPSQNTPAPGVGVYRQIIDGVCKKSATGTIQFTYTRTIKEPLKHAKNFKQLSLL